MLGRPLLGDDGSMRLERADNTGLAGLPDGGLPRQRGTGTGTGKTVVGGTSSNSGVPSLRILLVSHSGGKCSNSKAPGRLSGARRKQRLARVRS